MNALKWFVSTFPEAFYPCHPDLVRHYNYITVLGRQKASEQSIIICGICRDVINNLKFNIARIEKIGELFREYKVILYENDSKDGTKKLLKDWGEANKNVFIISEDLGTQKFTSVASFERASLLAECRNKYLNFMNERFDSDYVMMLDVDISGGWSYEGICNTVGHIDWDVVGSNGLLYGLVDEHGNIVHSGDRAGRVFYDTYAFRRVSHPEPHSSEEINQLVYSRGEPFVKVSSCFGGMAIYKRDAVRDVVYRSEPPNKAACEHAYFHFDMAKLGFDKIYINPSQITLYSPVSYTEI